MAMDKALQVDHKIIEDSAREFAGPYPAPCYGMG
jgi:hypothetical protein